MRRASERFSTRRVHYPPQSMPNRIRELRLRAMEQYPVAFRAADLAYRLGVSEASLIRWERGLTKPTQRHVRALAHEFGVGVEELGLTEASPDDDSSP